MTRARSSRARLAVAAEGVAFLLVAGWAVWTMLTAAETVLPLAVGTALLGLVVLRRSQRRRQLLAARCQDPGRDRGQE